MTSSLLSLLVLVVCCFLSIADVRAEVEVAQVNKTVLLWSRQLRTCDAVGDRDIALSGTSRIVYAYGSSDPANDNAVSYHGQNSRGLRNVNLMDEPYVPISPPDQQVLPLMSDPYQVNATTGSTYYHCQGFSTRVFSSKAHVIRVTPQIDFAHSGQVHHMLLFRCPAGLTAAEANWKGACYGGSTPRGINACDQQSVVAGWAVGGGEFIYPPETGYPLQGDAASQSVYFMMQIHYHNPNKLSFIDSAGFNLYYTHTLRQYDAAAFVVHHNLAVLSIPAQQPKYTTPIVCPAQCFAAANKQSGMIVFASMLHTHEVGIGLKVEHFRTVSANNVTQLADIDRNDAFDFAFQQVVTFSANNYPRIMPTDSLKLTCSYNTMKRTAVTRGGIATTDEMCMDYLWYYQEVPATPTMELGLAGLPAGCEGFLPVQNQTVFTSRCTNNAGVTENYLAFRPAAVTTPLPTQSCSPAASSHPYTKDGSFNTTFIDTATWLSIKSQYPRSEVLDDLGNYVLYWKVVMDADRQNGIISFAAEVATNGWVGMGISASGAMIDSDSIIGWVHTMAEGGANNSVSATDRYNTIYGVPPVDASQDTFNIQGTQGLLDLVSPPMNPIYYNVSGRMMESGGCVGHHGQWLVKPGCVKGVDGSDSGVEGVNVWMVSGMVLVVMMVLAGVVAGVVMYRRKVQQRNLLAEDLLTPASFTESQEQ